MNSRKLTGYYTWGVKLLIFAIPFLSLWISSSMFFPYITGRNFAFRILIEIALVLWVALAVLNKEYRPKFTPIVLAVSIFTVVIGLANFFGVDFYNSFWSRFERMEGYLMILHLAAYFFVTTSVFRNKKDWLVFFNLVVIAGILVGGYGILQVLGLKEAIQGGGVRIDGTIGNPTYLAAYLTLVIALSLVLLFNTTKKWLKYFYGAAIAFSFLVMFFTASRGAALAFLITIPLFLILYLIFYRKTEDAKEKLFKKIALTGLALMVIVPVSLLALKNTKLVQNSSVLSRVTSVSFQERTIKSRFQIWGIAWKAFQERPLLGWGQENFLPAFSKYYDPRLYDQEPWFDRPHNIIFEWLINGGILGLISYLGLFGAFFWNVFKLLKNKTIGRKEGLVLIVAPITYFLQNFFVFDNFNTYVLFFGLLAYVNSLNNGEDRTGKFEAKDPMPSIWAFSSSLLAMAIIAYFINLVPIAQSKGIIAGLQATGEQTDPLGKTLSAFKKTIDYNSFGTGEAMEQLARVATLLAGQSGITNDLKLPFLQYAIETVGGYVKAHPNYIRMHLMLAGLYQGMRGLNSQFIFQAREEMKIALSLSPNKQQILFVLADNYLNTNEIGKALELMDQAVKLEPSNVEARTNLAIVAIFSKQPQLVEKSIQGIADLRLDQPDHKSEYGAIRNYLIALKKIGETYLRFGPKFKAQEMLKMAKALRSDIIRTEGDLPDFDAIIEDFEGSVRE